MMLSQTHVISPMSVRGTTELGAKLERKGTAAFGSYRRNSRKEHDTIAIYNTSPKPYDKCQVKCENQD